MVSGVVVERFHDRSYKVISEKGRIVCRNRVDLKVYHKEVSIKFEDPRDPPSELPKSQDQTKMLPNTQTGDRHNQKRHLASSHSSQCNSSNFSKSHKQPKSSSQSIPWYLMLMAIAIEIKIKFLLLLHMPHHHHYRFTQMGLNPNHQSQRLV